MPELPEVETTRRGLVPLLSGTRITALIVRERRLRWPIEPALETLLPGRAITRIDRRGKYLLLNLGEGTLIIHLGMSGSLQVVPAAKPPGPWDPFDLQVTGDQALRMRDPRRFGALLYSRDPSSHPLLRHLGPEPLEPDFHGAHLHRRAHGRRIAVRDFLLNGQIVAGIGNIYANEALFTAGIRPGRPAGRISLERYDRLALAIVTVLKRAIAVGGTTLKDFSGSDGRPGYFQQQLKVYGRTGEPCLDCGSPIIRLTRLARSGFYCPHCQQ